MQSLKQKQSPPSLYTRLRLFFILFLVLPWLGYEGWFFLISKQESLQQQHLRGEYTHDDARKACQAINMQLPSMSQLVSLYKNNQLVYETTDYWSSLSLAAFAFGWSTRKKMPSFDPISDLDHVVCIQSTPSRKNGSNRSP